MEGAIVREDAEHLSLNDRWYLLRSGMRMVEEGIEGLAQEAIIRDGLSEDDEHLHDNLDDLRDSAYTQLLMHMSTDKEDAMSMIKMLNLALDDITEGYEE
tara:strand:+ start:433 stop:732 length:300 start_codon:yes stop_codon:yes gene_type:complete